MSTVLISTGLSQKYDILISRDRENSILLSARGPQGPAGGGGGGGSGTVTSVGVSGGTTGLTVSGSPVTTFGTITLAGTLAVANGGTGSTTASAARTALGLAIGTDVQAQDAELAAVAGLVSAADRVPYFTGSGTASLAVFTSAGRALVDDADASAQRTTLGLGTLATQSGTFSGTSSGTNTGDQTITLTGDVTGSGTGSFAATIANDAVTYAKLQNVTATDKLLGRSSVGAGDVEEIACTAAGRAIIDDADASAQRTTLGLGTLATQSGTFSGTSSGTNTGDQTITLTGDVTGSGTGSFAATIAADAVTYAKMQDVTATDRILGRSTAGAGIVEEIVCTAAGRAILDDADAAAQRTTLGAASSTHASTHQSGGADAIKLDDLAAPDDNTDLNASTTNHGLLQKLPGGTTTFLRADGSFAAPATGSGYAVSLGGNGTSLSLADSTSYFVGSSYSNYGSSSANVEIVIPKDGTITHWSIHVRISSVLGSTETVPHYLRLNDTTDFGLINLVYDAANRFGNTTASQAVVANDRLCMKVPTPAWATNPTGVTWEAWVVIV